MERIHWVTSECFNAVAQLSQLDASAQIKPDLVHARMRSLLDRLAQRAREAGYGEQDSKLMLYALAALADEVMMAAGGPLREYWASQPMQLLLFRENVAGERFFENLELVRRSPQQLDVLRTYYLCLLFGFRGRYSVRGAEVALSDLIDGVRTQIARTLVMPEVLSPNGARPEEGFADVTRRMPVLAMAAGVLALSLVLYLGLVVSLRDQLAQLVTWMNQSTSGG